MSSQPRGPAPIASGRTEALPAFIGPAEDPDDEPWDTLADAPDPRRRPFSLAGGGGRAGALVWTQKPCVARWIWPGETAPVPVVACYAAPSVGSLRGVLARYAPRRVLVVTDLDPWGVALSLHLRSRCGHLAPDVPVIHRGVGDALLALSDAWLPIDGRSAPSMLSMPLSPNEIERWRWLRPMARAVVDPASMALLDAGHKREVEGATNPGCHRAGYADALRAWLLAP